MSEFNHNLEQTYSDNNVKPWVFPTKLVVLLCFIIFVVRMLIKNRKGTQQQSLQVEYNFDIQERLWKKFAFSHNELFDSMNMEEKELLKHTYLNTVQNAKSILVNDYEDRRKSSKRVSFSLENNQTQTIPYYSKMID